MLAVAGSPAQPGSVPSSLSIGRTGRVERAGSSGPGQAGRARKRPRAGSRGPRPDRKQRGGGAARHQSSRPAESRPRPGRRVGLSESRPAIWILVCADCHRAYQHRCCRHCRYRSHHCDPFIIVLIIIIRLFLIQTLSACPLSKRAGRERGGQGRRRKAYVSAHIEQKSRIDHTRASTGPAGRPARQRAGRERAGQGRGTGARVRSHARILITPRLRRAALQGRVRGTA